MAKKKLIKKYQDSGAITLEDPFALTKYLEATKYLNIPLAARLVQKYTHPDNPKVTYVKFADAMKHNLPFVADVNDPNSGWYYSYAIADNSKLGTAANSGETFRNNMGGEPVDPETTYVPIDDYGRIINNEGANAILHGQNLSLIDNTYGYNKESGWFKLPSSIDQGQIYDKSRRDLANTSRQFLTTLGYENAWHLNDEAAISLANAARQSIGWGTLAAFTPGAYNWLTTTNAGRGLVTGTLAGEGFNLGAKAMGYEDWGHAASENFGGNPTVWNYFGNPGYLFGSGLASKIVEGTIEPVVSNVAKLGLATTMLNAADKYGLGEGTKAAIYNTNLGINSINYALQNPKIVGNAMLLHLNLRFLDAAWTLKNGLFPKKFRSRMANASYLDPDLSAYKPSDRALVQLLADLIENLNKYLNSHRRGPRGRIRYVKTVLPDEEVLMSYDIDPAQIEVSSSLDYFAEPSFRFVDPMNAKVGLTSAKVFTNSLEGEILYGHSADVLAQPFTRSTRHTLAFGGMSDLPVENKEVSPIVKEVDDLLEDLGHVTGSLITFTNPYATHTPNDIDIITTENNLKAVIAKLQGTNEIFGSGHVRVDTPKYGTVDIQIIENGASGTSKGKIALEIYQKYNPQGYYHGLESGDYAVPMSPEELLKIHKDNVLAFSNIDLLISGSEKHAARNLNILRCPDQNIVKNATNDLENVYKTYLGSDFLSIEDLGVKLNYSDVESNLLFLLKLGFKNADQIAKEPVRMEYLIKSILYLTHTSNRVVSGKGGQLTTTDILKAMHTNGSSSNKGGNSAREKFGGGISYGESDPYVGMIEFPIKHPEQLKTAMDVYNYLSKIIDVSEVRSWYKGRYVGPVYLDSRFFSSTFMDNVLRDSKLDPETALKVIDLLKPFDTIDVNDTNMSSLVTHTVPNRNPSLNVSMSYGWDYDPLVAERLYNINDKFANILDINHIYSIQNGFNDLFVGRYARHIPNLRSTVIPGSDKNRVYFSGFELPTMSFKSPEVTYESVKPAYDLGYLMPSIKPILKAREASMRNNMAKQDKADQLRRDAYDLALRLRSSLYASIRKVKNARQLATILGAGAAGIYGISKLSTDGFVARQVARDVTNNINYKNKEELKKYLEDEYEVYLTDEQYDILDKLANNTTSTPFYAELKDMLYKYLKSQK